MIDTAGTVVSAANLLIDRGAAEVYIAATHGLLSGPAVDRLKNGPIREVVVTNTVPVPDEKRFDSLRVLSIAPLLARGDRPRVRRRLGERPLRRRQRLGRRQRSDRRGAERESTRKIGRRQRSDRRGAERESTRKIGRRQRSDRRGAERESTRKIGRRQRSDRRGAEHRAASGREVGTPPSRERDHKSWSRPDFASGSRF